MRSVPDYRFSCTLATYLTEDVPCTLVPVSDLARRAGLATLVIDSVIAMASVLTGEDFLKCGRTLGKLGWGDFGHQEIGQWMK